MFAAHRVQAKEEALAALRDALDISDAQHVEVMKQIGPGARPTRNAAPHGADVKPRPPPPGQAGRKRKASDVNNSNGKLTPNMRLSPSLAHAGPALPAAFPPGGAVDPLVGRKVMRHWPREGGWFQGLITDYSPATGMHAITYDMGTPKESYEWFRVKGATAKECVVKEVADLSGMAAAAHGRSAGAGAVVRRPAAAAAVAPPASASRPVELARPVGQGVNKSALLRGGMSAAYSLNGLPRVYNKRSLREESDEDEDDEDD